MSGNAGPIYEVTLSIDREIIESFDAWLAHHIEEMLALPGFLEARVFSVQDDNEDRIRRVTHYYLESETDLQRYLTDHAADMRQSGIDRFGDRFAAKRRMLQQTDIAEIDLRKTESCLNCGAQLGGQYCGNCGQRAQSRLISLWELTRDAFGDLFEFDSRIWRTIVPLLVRPGKLTREYLEGRRARFMPPFRTYLVLSILFFVVLLFNPKEEFGIFFEPEANTAGEVEGDGKSADEIREEVLRELASEGIIAGPSESDATAADTDDAATDDKAGAGTGFEITTDGEDDDCNFDSVGSEDMPEWLARRVTKERLQIICERVTADNGSALLAKLKDNIPAALFFLLPLMAFTLKLLYPLSKRYYVEHLLFVVHYHAFFFLLMILQMLYARLAAFVGLPETIVDFTLVITSFYVPVYLYKAMRRVYGQRHAATVPKYLLLVIAYFAGLLLVLGITALLAAFSI